MPVQKSTRFLDYFFSDAEKEEMSKSVMENIGKIDELTSEKKASNKSFSDKINGLHDQNSETAGKILHGSEQRAIAVEITFNHPKDGIKTIVRMDSNESWEEPMKDHEYTLDNLPLPGVNDGTNDENETDEEE